MTAAELEAFMVKWFEKQENEFGSAGYVLGPGNCSETCLDGSWELRELAAAILAAVKEKP